VSNACGSRYKSRCVQNLYKNLSAWKWNFFALGAEMHSLWKNYAFAPLLNGNFSLFGKHSRFVSKKLKFFPKSFGC
jgi:hypothetical protein